MRLRNLIAKSVIVGAFVLTVSACIPAQQGGPGSTSAPVVAAQINRGPQQDPNLPVITFETNAPITWNYNGTSSVPSVSFKNPADEGVYLGFNENGSMLLNQGKGNVYYWKLTDPKTMTGTLTEAFKSFKDIPLDTLAALQNPGTVAKALLAKNGRGPKPVTPPQQQPPQNPDKSGGLFGDRPQETLQGLAPAAGVPADITGNNASIKSGVLTFILGDGSKSKPYTVVRPAFMANTPQAAGIAGTWIAMESGGKGILFNVRADNTVTGKEISSQVVQMLMQGRGQQ
jgi:hypothetical protein